MSLIAEIELVVGVRIAESKDASLKVTVPGPRSSLAAAGLKVSHLDAKRDTGLTSIAMRAISEHAASTKPVCHEFRVGVVVNQVAGGGHL